jgi:hypothetical protein
MVFSSRLNLHELWLCFISGIDFRDVLLTNKSISFVPNQGSSNLNLQYRGVSQFKVSVDRRIEQDH